MSDSKTVKVYLTGPKAGKTMVLTSSIQAIDGAIEVDPSDKRLLRYLKKFYQVSATDPLAVSKPKTQTSKE